MKSFLILPQSSWFSPPSQPHLFGPDSWGGGGGGMHGGAEEWEGRQKPHLCPNTAMHPGVGPQVQAPSVAGGVLSGRPGGLGAGQLLLRAQRPGCLLSLDSERPGPWSLSPMCHSEH